MFDIKKLKYTALALPVMVAFSMAPAQANDMINNQASGYVDGDIVQEAGILETEDLQVGSISAPRAFDNTAQGYVGGRVTQMGNLWSGSPNAPNKLVAHVGSIDAADDATNNHASGTVSGEIYQDASQGTDVQLDLRVGSIDAPRGSTGFGQALDNTADGFVNGNVYQVGFDGARVKARIGSIAP